jgi:hypothetical protein
MKSHLKAMRRKILTYLCCAVLLLASVSVFAEKPPEPPLNEQPPPGLPLNGGLSYLFIVAAAYGVYAIRKRVKD